MKNNNPFVSVVIPSYNRAEDLKRAVQSVINQTYQNWEIIIVDNSSTDNTIQVIEAFSDSRIRLFNIQNDGVIAKSRNLGIQSARGDWIALLDSDDWWLPRKIEISISEAIRNGADIVYHDLYLATKYPFRFIFRKVKTRSLKEPILRDLLQNGNAIINSSVVFRKALLDEVGFLDESKELIAWEDFDFWLRIAKANKKFHRISTCLGYYWAGGGNISGDHKTLLILDEIQKKYSIEMKNLNVWWIHLAKAKIYYKLKKQELAKFELSKCNPIHWEDKLKKLIWKLIFGFTLLEK